MKKDIIIQARIGSTRLPAKTMLSLAGKPTLHHVVERLRYVNNIDDIIIATTTNPEDDIIVRWCENNNIKCFRGSSENVLKRYYDAAKYYKSDIVIRVTSDCPLIDPYIVQDMVDKFDPKSYDYMGNVLKRSFPRGLDAEIFTFDALKEAFNKVFEPFELEHVTPWIRNNKKIATYEVSSKYNSNARLTLDELRDYQLLSLIYDVFYKEGKIINTLETINFLENNPEIKNINLSVKQKAG